MDIALLDGVAYVLVTFVGFDVGGSDVVGIYRVDGSDQFTVIADIGAFSMANPPEFEFEAPTGVHFAIEPSHGRLLVTDGHRNRVLEVFPDGAIREVIAFGNVVPNGMAARGNIVFMTLAGPVPHLPEDGKVIAFGPQLPAVEAASGAPLFVDVEFGLGNRLYTLSQGVWDGPFEGTLALPDTGSLFKVPGDGTLAVVMDGLDRPISLEFI